MTKFTSDITTIALDPCNFEPAVWTDCATKLRLKYLANHPELPKELKEAGLPADQAVLHILRLECFYRETHKIEMNMGMAKFPSQASIESFDFSCFLLFSFVFSFSVAFFIYLIDILRNL